MSLMAVIGGIAYALGCDEYGELDSETDLNLQTTLNAILAKGATTEVSLCPCSQPANI